MVRIITDTTSVLPFEISQKYHIPVIPQVINFDNESYLEGIELDNQTFMQKLVNSKTLPKTAAPPPELFVEEFKKMVGQNETILCIHPSAEVSGTVRSATIASREFPDADIRIIDSRLIASALATLVELAGQWAVEGFSGDDIERKILEMIPTCRLYFLVSTLEYLIKGGRIGGAAGLVGSVLQIKPILTFVNGRVEAYEKERTHKRAVERLCTIVSEQLKDPVNGHLSVMHAGVPQQGEALAKQLEQQLAINRVPIYEVPPAIITHGGPGILGVAFFCSP